MNCKNCQANISTEDKFCSKCGAKIIKERITTKRLLDNFFDAIGWDRGFFLTLRLLTYQPQTVVKNYIDGTRKKYANPFSFFAINLAISLFFITQYSDKFIEISSNLNLTQIETISKVQGSNTRNTKQVNTFNGNVKEFTKSATAFQIKYYNLISFLLLPLYTFIAFFAFGKPHNYGEHLVINTYLQGFLLLFSTSLFVLSLLIKVDLFVIGSLLSSFFYYLYTYKKLNALSFDQLLIKILRFFVIVFLIMLIPIFIGLGYAISRDLG